MSCGVVNINDLSNSDILQYAIDNGIIDLSNVQHEIEMNKRKKYLAMHNHSIWQGTNHKWYTKLPQENGRLKLVKRTTEEAIEDAIVDFYEQKESNPTVEEMYNMWVKEKITDNEISISTKDRYDSDFSKYFKDTDFSKSKVATINDSQIEEFIRNTIVSFNLSQKAYSGVRTILNGVFKYAKRKKYINWSITYTMKDIELSSKMFSKSVKDKRDQVYQEDEIPIMTEFLKSEPDIWNLGILFAFQTGLRVGELSTVKPTDKIGSMLHIQRTEVKYKHDDGICHREVREFPKTEAGDRYVILTEKALETYNKILRINPNGEYLFENPVKRNRICGSSFDKRIGNNCKKLGFNRKSMHKIRKTFGTILIDSDVDESIITEQMGHKDIETTRKYYYFSNKNDKTKRNQIVEAIGNIG